MCACNPTSERFERSGSSTPAGRVRWSAVIWGHVRMRRSGICEKRRTSITLRMSAAQRAGGGHPLIVMVDEGWFWMIPLDEQRTSVGLVMDADISRQVQRRIGLTAEGMLRWGIGAARRWPRMTCAQGPQTNHIAADFSYRCRPYAGAGYFLVGDAAAFMDPIFSTGVCLAMTGSAAAARSVLAILDGKASARAAARNTSSCWSRARGRCSRSFATIMTIPSASLFLNGTGPLQMHRAVIGVLAGNVFPTPWRLRWRMALFNLCVAVNRWVPLVPRRDRHSLLAHEPVGPAHELWFDRTSV